MCLNTVNSALNILLASKTGTLREIQSPEDETGLPEALNGTRVSLIKDIVSEVGLTNSLTYESQIITAQLNMAQ